MKRHLAIWGAIILSGLLHAASFPPFNVAEAAYIFAVPALLAFGFSQPRKREWLVALFSGWISWAVLIAWLRLFSSHLDVAMPWFPGLVAWLALSLGIGIFLGGWVYVAGRVFRLSLSKGLIVRLVSVLSLAALWVLLEWLRSWLFTGFPWLPLSTSQWQRPLLLQLASFTGGYGISFVLIAFNIGLSYYFWIIWTRKREKWYRRLCYEFYLALFVLFLAIGSGVSSFSEGKDRSHLFNVGFVQPDVGAMDKWTRESFRELLDDLEQLSSYSTYLGADVVLWPESPTPAPVIGNDQMKRWAEGLSSSLEVPLLMGNIARIGSGDNEEWFNGIFVVDPQDGIDERFYAKRHLVPFGEYLPSWLQFLGTVVPLPGEFKPGTAARPLTLKTAEASVKIGGLVCYEDTFPSLSREFPRLGVDAVFVASNNAWFGEGAGAYQHAAHSVLRAVEIRRPIIRCGNSGWSGWVDEFGQIRHVMLDEKGSVYFQGAESVAIDQSNYWSKRLSFYVLNGNWFLFVCVVFLIPLWPVIHYGPSASGKSERANKIDDSRRLRPRFSIRRN